MSTKDKLRKGLISEEVETTNIAKIGDYIVKNPTGEEYVLTKDKFIKNYINEPFNSEDDNGYCEYKNKAETRNIVIIDEKISSELLVKFGDKTPSQSTFFDFMSKYDTIKAEKDVIVKARVAKVEETVITKTRKENDSGIIIKFGAPWGGDMILKKNDIIVIMSDEVYRIGKYEFDNTYVIKK